MEKLSVKMGGGEYVSPEWGRQELLIFLMAMAGKEKGGGNPPVPRNDQNQSYVVATP